jgi:hypothetical protein
MSMGVLFQLALPYVSGFLALATLGACGMGAIKQRVGVAKAAWGFAGLAAISCGNAFGQTGAESTATISRSGLVLSAAIFAIGLLVQWAVIAAEGKRMKLSRFLGSIVLAGVGGASACLFALDVLHVGPAFSAVSGVGAAYAGGTAVLKRFGAGAEASIPESARAKE